MLAVGADAAAGLQFGADPSLRVPRPWVVERAENDETCAVHGVRAAGLVPDTGDPA